MKVCILCDEAERGYDYSEYFKEYDWQVHWIAHATAIKQVRSLAHCGFDVFVNLCDGMRDEARAGIAVVRELERLRVPFTGARSDFYDPARETMKRVCRAVGVKTPRHVFAANAEQVEIAAQQLRFPLIAKHPQGYCSEGLTKKSRVETVGQLCAQAWRMIQAYSSTLIEEFIEGREFTVLAAENPSNPAAPITYRPVEFRFPAGESFKHYDLKWIDYATMECVPCTDRRLARRLRELSAKVFVGLNGSGYGRCDIRMDAAGELYLLEINPNCGIFYAPDELGSADFILINDPAGHHGFLKQIIAAAFARHRRSAKTRRIGNAKTLSSRELFIANAT